MPVNLEFLGKDIQRRNMDLFVEHLRRLYPHVSITGIQEMAKAELGAVAPRWEGYIVHFIGRDILSEDPRTIPAWQWFSKTERGKAYDAQRDQIRPVTDRLQMMDVTLPLETTYVWRLANGWTQTVSDADVEVIRRHPKARLWFQNADVYGPWTVKRAWDLPVTERLTFTNPDEALRYRKDLTRKHYVRGGSVGSR